MSDKIKTIMLEDLVSYLDKLDDDIAKYEKEGMPTFFLDCLHAQTKGLINRIKEIKKWSQNT